MSDSDKSIAIIGAGFGGLAVARDLAGTKGLKIHVIDRKNHHLFQPLLYQVAVAGLNPSEIAVPIRKMFSKKDNVIVTLAEIEKLDVKSKSVFYDGNWQQYDYLVIACGAKHSYFGNDQWESLAPGLKNIEQATEIRRRILTAFELAEKETNPEVMQAYLSFAVVGGGPTGVEMAGAISEMAKVTLKKDYQRADLGKTKVYLIEGGPRVLAGFPEKLSVQAEEDLKAMGVNVITNQLAGDLSEKGLKAGDEFIPCRTIVWAAGVRPSKLLDTLECEKDKQGRIKVNSDLTLPKEKNVFAIGDIAHLKDENGDTLPGVAPVAMQQGQFVADCIQKDLKSKERKKFKYWDKGLMATIGRSRAVLVSGPVQMSGFLAWLAWVFIHILYLMRFKNRFFVFLQWVWSYFKFGQGARLIVHKTWRFYSDKKISYEPEHNSD